MHRTLAEAIESIALGIRESNRPEDRKLAADYLAALAPVLAAVVLGKDVLRELPAIERLFGDTRLIDDAPFQEGLAKWRQFREEYETWMLSPLTVNERLFALGTIDAFDRARAAGDKETMGRLLTEARVDTPSIRKIVSGP
jgi:hypothetical protein